MNYIVKSLCMVGLLSLVACTPSDNVETSDTTDTTTLETPNQEEPMANLEGAVVIDTNHPLAGETLNFEVEIVEISKGEGNTNENVVESGDAIEVHYVGTKTDGEQFDSSRDRGQTLPFTVGGGQMIAGFDAGVVGMELGETKTLTIAPEDAYGVRDESRMETIPKQDLTSFVNAGFKLEVGERLPTQYGEFEIVEVLDEVPENTQNNTNSGSTDNQ